MVLLKLKRIFIFLLGYPTVKETNSEISIYASGKIFKRKCPHLELQIRVHKSLFTTFT